MRVGGHPRPTPLLAVRPRYLSGSLVGHAVALLVRADLLAHQPRIETGVRPAVSAATAVTRMGRQERAHVLLGNGFEVAAEFGVQRPDGRERVTDEVGELHVDHPLSAQRVA